MSSQRLFAALVIVLALALVVPAFAQEGTGVTVEAHQRVNVRSGPATTYAVIGQMNAGDVVNATGRDSSANDWLQIDFQGQPGWVAYFTVYVNGDPDSLPIVTVEAPAEQPAADQPAAEGAALTATTDLNLRAHTNVNVRSGPAALYTVIGQLHAQDMADITGRDSAATDWLRIDFGGVEGWVSFEAVEVNGDPDQAEIVPPGPTAQFITTPAQQNAAARQNVVYSTRLNVNLRATPALSGAVLITIPANTQLRPDGRTATSNWIRVTYEGQTGWIVTGMAVRISGDLRTVPVIAQ